MSDAQKENCLCLNCLCLQSGIDHCVGYNQIYILVHQARSFGTAAVLMLRLKFVQPFSKSLLKSLQYTATEYSLWDINTESRDLHFWNSDMDNKKCISIFCNANKTRAESIHADTGYLLTQIFILLRKDTFELKDICLYLCNFPNNCFLCPVRGRKRLNRMKDKCNISYLAP